MHLKNAKLIPIDSGPPSEPFFVKAYLLVHDSGDAVLIDPGPATAATSLLKKLEDLGLGSKYKLRAVLVTHIHLDHYGAGTTIVNKLRIPLVVHPHATKHVVNPEKLWSAAQQILGSRAYDFGKPEPVPENIVVPTSDGETLRFGELEIVVIHTPGHAPHHQVFLFDKCVFSGDAAGAYLDEIDVIVPASPIGVRLDMYVTSLRRIRELDIEVLAPTHMSIATKGIEVLDRHIQQVELWIKVIKDRVSRNENVTLGDIAVYDKELQKLLNCSSSKCLALLRSAESSLEGFLYDIRRSMVSGKS